MWPFDHLVILPFYALLLDLSFISWLKIGFVAYLMKRKKTEQEETKKRFLPALFYLFIIYYLLFIIYCLFPYPLSPDRFLKRDGEQIGRAHV